MGMDGCKKQQSAFHPNKSNQCNCMEADEMKKTLVFVMVTMVFALLTTLGIGGEKTSLDLKVGDALYVCNCGEACPCHTISTNVGNCTCGKEMVKAKVVKVGQGTADFMAEGWEKARTFNTVGKYACDCGPQCPCNTISQNPGKCTCGKEMKAVM
jgi:hypothetical protein